MNGSLHARGFGRRSMIPAILGGWLMIMAAPATAAVTCDYFDPGSSPRLYVDYAGVGESAVLRRAGDAIHVNGSACESAAVTNTDYVQFRDNSGGNVKATISLTGGPFEPGSPGQSSGEVQFYPDLDYAGTSSAGDQLMIEGSDGAEVIRYGVYVEGGTQHYINLDADEATAYADIADGHYDPGSSAFVPSVEIFRFFGGGGADRVSGLGGAGTGALFDDPLLLSGQAGSDALTGGAVADILVGGQGPDTLRGAGGGDTIKGSAGNDVLIGGPGPDVLVGGPGRDKCRGGAGRDVLRSCEV